MTIGITSRWLISRAFTEADADRTVRALDIPPGTYVADVLLLVTEPLSGGAIDVGDAADPDGWIHGGTMPADLTGVYRGKGTSSGYRSAGKYYEDAATIDVAVATDLSGGAAYVLAHCLDLGGVL